MLKVNKYKLESKKIKNKQKILLIADIHLCDDYDEKIDLEVDSDGINLKFKT